MLSNAIVKAPIVGMDINVVSKHPKTKLKNKAQDISEETINFTPFKIKWNDQSTIETTSKLLKLFVRSIKIRIFRENW